MDGTASQHEGGLLSAQDKFIWRGQSQQLGSSDKPFHDSVLRRLRRSIRGYAACVMIGRVQGDPVMLSNRFTVAALAAACIVAAGAGGYLASRQNATTPV